MYTASSFRDQAINCIVDNKLSTLKILILAGVAPKGYMLRAACAHNRTKMIRYLVSIGVSPNSVIESVFYTNKPHQLDLLYQLGGRLEMLSAYTVSQFVRKKRFLTVDVLIKYGFDLKDTVMYLTKKDASLYSIKDYYKKHGINI